MTLSTTLGAILADSGDHYDQGAGCGSSARGGLSRDEADRRRSASDPGDSARATLAERHARGEIDRNEYLEKLEDLTP